MNTLEAQRRVGNWVRTRFGDGAMARHERAMRLLEEAIELAQAEGITPTEIDRLTANVFHKPAGAPSQEAAGVGVCLLAWAAGAGEDLWSLIEQEIERIESKPVEYFRARHRIKSDAGIALAAGDSKDYGSQ